MENEENQEAIEQVEEIQVHEDVDQQEQQNEDNNQNGDENIANTDYNDEEANQEGTIQIETIQITEEIPADEFAQDSGDGAYTNDQAQEDKHIVEQIEIQKIEITDHGIEVTETIQTIEIENAEVSAEDKIEEIQAATEENPSEEVAQTEENAQVDQNQQTEEAGNTEEAAQTEEAVQVEEPKEVQANEETEVPPLNIAAPHKVFRQVTSQSSAEDATGNIEANDQDDFNNFETAAEDTDQAKSEDAKASGIVKERMAAFTKSPGEEAPKTSSGVADTSVISTSVKDLTGAFSTQKEAQPSSSSKASVRTKEKVSIDPEGLPIFNEVKNDHNHKYLIYGIEGSLIKLLEVGEKDASVDDFLSKLNDKECRYCVLDHVFDKVDQYGKRQATKLFFISWIPVSSPPLSKMQYTSERGGLVANFQGVSEITCGSKDDILSALGVKA